VLNHPKTEREFVTNITTVVANNAALKECSTPTIISGALQGASLKLSPAPQLGQFYLIPFNNKKTGVKDAVFVLGYQGMLQLAMRTGQYTKIVASPVKQGELSNFNPITETYYFEPNVSGDRDSLETVGYYARFELVNGFVKEMYWPKEKMLYHADRYSAAFNKDTYALIKAGKVAQKDMWKYSSYWYGDFDGMAKKTMLRQLLKGAPMSLEMQGAIAADERVISSSSDGLFERTNVAELPESEVEVVETPTDKPKGQATLDDI